MGYIDLRQRLHATTMQLQTLQLISEGVRCRRQWEGVAGWLAGCSGAPLHTADICACLAYTPAAFASLAARPQRLLDE